MTNEELSQLPAYPWMESRIPALDALTTFDPDNGTGPDPVIAETIRRMGGSSRWYPVSGGHRVVIPYNGQPYDRARFAIEPRIWDHEHCSVCNTHIPAMTFCWVTQHGRYYLLCIDCHTRHVAARTPKRPWWRFW
jgi:hypothetical protein